MVFRIAVNGTEALNLNTAADNFGNDDDIVTVADSYGVTGVVATYAGDDTIVLNNLSSGFGGPIMGGTGGDIIIGGSNTEVINDGDGDDFVFGKGGADELFADRGDDLYNGGAGTDIIHFSSLDSNGPGQGIANTTAVICDLAITGEQDLGVFGIDTLRNIENIFGGGGDDRFFGTDGVNAIEGRDGNDTVNGRGGDDLLFAFNGADSMIGGLGADTIVLDEPGGANRDRVRYFSIAESGTTATTRDSILDFDAGSESTADRIDLRQIDARPLASGNQNFTFVDAFTNAAGEVRATISGSDTLISVDTDSDSAAEMTILLVGVTGITSADFIL